MRLILKQIPLQHSKIIHNPDSLRTKLLGIKWTIDYKSICVADMCNKLVDYLNLSSCENWADVSESKIRDMIKYLD